MEIKKMVGVGQDNMSSSRNMTCSFLPQPQSKMVLKQIFNTFIEKLGRRQGCQFRHFRIVLSIESKG